MHSVKDFEYYDGGDGEEEEKEEEEEEERDTACLEKLF